MTKPVLIAMVGLPRSGKSTIVAQLMQDFGAPVVRRDAIRLALHGQRFQADAEPMVKAISLYMIKSLFLSGHQFVICDETNFSKAARKSIQSPDWETLWYPVMTDPETCKARANETGQPDLIPIIEEMAARFEPLEPTDPLIAHKVWAMAKVPRVVGAAPSQDEIILTDKALKGVILGEGN